MIEADLQKFQRELDLLEIAGERSPQFIRSMTKSVGRAAMVPWRHAVAKQSGVKVREVQRATKARSFADAGDFVYELKITADYSYLSRFDAKQTGAGVEAGPWGDRKVFAGTFLGELEYGMSNASPFATGSHTAVLMRKGDDSLPVRQLYGPNIAVEAVRDQPPEVFEKEVEGAFNVQFQAQLNQLFA